MSAVNQESHIITPVVSLPPWLSKPGGVTAPTVTATPALSVALSLSPSSVRWPLPETTGNHDVIADIMECSRKLEEGHRMWAEHKKEASWRLSRVERQLESEKAALRKEKTEEVETKIRLIREELSSTLDRIELDFHDQILEMRREAEEKEQKLGEQWATKHAQLLKCVQLLGKN